MLNGLHLFQIQREQASTADLHQLLIAHPRQRNSGCGSFWAGLNLFRWLDMGMRCIGGGMSDVQLILLNHRIVQEGLSDAAYIGLAQTAIE